MELNERDIIERVLPFLKSYYKGYQRSSEITISSELSDGRGIVADCFLSFRDENNTNFTTTAEATSRLKSGEVKYTFHHSLALWDSFATAAVLVSTLLVLGYVFEWIVIPENRYVFFLIGVWFSVLGVGGTMYFILAVRNPIRRYRYIPAVEQFKQYFANEQWIAVGDDVFDSQENPHYLELRRQCILYGLGLLEVTPEEPVRMILTPARTQQVKGRRQTELFAERDWVKKSTQLLTDNSAFRQYRKLQRQGWQYATEQIGSILPLERFQRAWYPKQFGIMLAGVLLITFMLFEIWIDRPIHSIDSFWYRARIQNHHKDHYKGIETLNYIVEDTAYLLPISPGLNPYLGDKGEAYRSIYIPRADVFEDKSRAGTPNTQNIPTDPASGAPNPCVAFADLGTTHYLIFEQHYPSVQAADLRQKFFEVSALPMYIIPERCFASSGERQMLTVGALYPDREKALFMRDSFQRTLQPLDSNLVLKVLAIVPPEQ